jgi:hypothetical protein
MVLDNHLPLFTRGTESATQNAKLLVTVKPNSRLQWIAWVQTFEVQVRDTSVTSSETTYITKRWH